VAGRDEHDVLRAALAGLEPRSATEATDLARVLAAVEAGDPWSRATDLHVTGSALVVHPPTKRVLLRWHRRQQAWLQVGGHADPGEVDPFAVALREAAEETGLADLAAWPGEPPAPLHLVVVRVPAAGTEPAHAHADLRYVLATARPDDVVAEAPDAPLRWLTLDEAGALTSEDNLKDSLARVAALLDAG
jgi:8-oxo-dGTP pyrophosphatase MutT (NUDIX family)